MKYNFTEKDKSAIKKAIQNLESETSSELLVYIEEESHGYPETCWMMSTMMGFSVALLLSLMSFMWFLPLPFDALIYGLIVAISMMVGYAIPLYIDRFRLLLTPRVAIEEMAIARAKAIFLEKEIFKLHNRAGILLYISLLEHEVVVLGDEGIHAHAGTDNWVAVVEKVIEGNKRKDLVTAIVNAIETCKEYLLKYGFHPTPFDQNVLDDEVNFK